MLRMSLGSVRNRSLMLFRNTFPAGLSMIGTTKEGAIAAAAAAAAIIAAAAADPSWAIVVADLS